jgi:pentatricopeptide repeat protein
VPNLSYYASFTVILAGFAQNGPEDKAFELFAEMAGEGNPCTGHQEVLQKEHPCLQWFDQYVSKVCRVGRVCPSVWMRHPVKTQFQSALLLYSPVLDNAM